MLIKTENPETLRKSIEMISELVTEVRIKIGDYGLSISAMDPANVAMVGFKIPKSSFSEFNTENEEKLGINLNDLKRILKRTGAKSSLKLEKKENTLEIQIEDRIKRKFTLALLDIDSQEINFSEKIEKMEFSSSIELKSIDLIDAIEDCAVVSDSCLFKIIDGKFIVSSKGINSSRTEFSGDEAKINAEECASKYSVEYLQKFIKGAKLCEKTILKFANDHPLKIEFNTGDSELDFILAPRVETE
jgi:proliferating cell nuclear antigen